MAGKVYECLKYFLPADAIKADMNRIGVFDGVRLLEDKQKIED